MRAHLRQDLIDLVCLVMGTVVKSRRAVGEVTRALLAA